MRILTDHHERSAKPATGGCRSRSQTTLPPFTWPAIAALFAFLFIATTPAAHAQRAVIVIDGERIELDFDDDDVDQLRQRLEQQLRDLPAEARNPQWRHMPTENITLPDDETLRGIEIDSVLLDRVAMLNSESYSAREQATADLLDAPHENMQFYAVLAQADLTAEQRMRLLTILQRRLMDAPRGAVGISMRPHRALDGTTHVEVIDLIEGLPARQVLQIGDRITHIDGKPLDSPDQLRLNVQSRRPGEQINLTVLRPRRDERGRPLPDDDGNVHDELQLELTLGSADVLDEVNSARGSSNNAVEHLRRQQAQAIMERFGPQHDSIEIDRERFSINDEDAADHVTQRMLARFVEQHPAIVQIRQHRRMLEENGMDPPNVLRAQWMETETRLQSQLEFGDLSDDHRMVLEAVLDRFRELMIE